MMTLDEIRALTEEDMKSVNIMIETKLHTNVALIDQLSTYIINSGGKRLRPMLTLIAARACGYQGTSHHNLAAIIEFIHTATLLHDDVVDESDMRRGKKTANNVWGNQAAVLVGDFLYSRSFQMMVEVGNMDIMNVMAETTNIIAEGEVLQLINIGDAELQEATYIKVIDCKTGKLFEAACRIGAIVADQEQTIQQAIAQYGIHLGRAYQLVDDALDYSAESSDQLGKNIGDDLAEGKTTLPLIWAMQHGNAEQKTLIKQTIENGGGLDHIDAINQAIIDTKALDYTNKRAQEEAALAIESLSALPDNDWKAALTGLAEFCVARSY